MCSCFCVSGDGQYNICTRFYIYAAELGNLKAMIVYVCMGGVYYIYVHVLWRSGLPTLRTCVPIFSLSALTAHRFYSPSDSE